MSQQKRKLDDDPYTKHCKVYRFNGYAPVVTDLSLFENFNHTVQDADNIRSTLLSLPTELRLEIYSFLFAGCQTYPKRVKKEGVARKHAALPEHHPVSPSRSKSARPDPPGSKVFRLTTDKTPPPYYQLGLARAATILFVNKQIYAEARSIYWRCVTVKIRAESVKDLVRFWRQPNWNENGQMRNLLLEPFRVRKPYITTSDFEFSSLCSIRDNLSLHRLTLLVYLPQTPTRSRPELRAIISNLHLYVWIPEIEIAWHATRDAPRLEDVEFWFKEALAHRGLRRKVNRPLWSTWYPEHSFVLSK